MIASVELKSGFVAELPGIKGRKFEFKDQCNILFGPNGCGKTSLLKVLAGYTGITTNDKMFCGGWSKPPKGFSFDKPKEFPEQFSENTVGKVEAVVDWDGTPTFLNSAAMSEGGSKLGFFVESAEDSPDGMMDMQEQIGLITGHFSDGELRLYKIGKLVKAIQNPPVLPKTSKKDDGDAFKKYVKYLNSLPRNGKLTVLLDEPDRSLNVKNQVDFWTKFVPNLLTHNFQLIIATHSFIPLIIPKFDFMNIIDLEEGYYENSRKKIKDMLEITLSLETKKEEPTEVKKPKTKKKKSV